SIESGWGKTAITAGAAAGLTLTGLYSPAIARGISALGSRIISSPTVRNTLKTIGKGTLSTGVGAAAGYGIDSLRANDTRNSNITATVGGGLAGAVGYAAYRYGPQAYNAIRNSSLVNRAVTFLRNSPTAGKLATATAVGTTAAGATALLNRYDISIPGLDSIESGWGKTAITAGAAAGLTLTGLYSPAIARGISALGSRIIRNPSVRNILGRGVAGATAGYALDTVAFNDGSQNTKPGSMAAGALVAISPSLFRTQRVQNFIQRALTMRNIGSFLKWSTAAAQVEMQRPVYDSLKDSQFAGVSGLTGLVLNPGRNILATVGDWSNWASRRVLGYNINDWSERLEGKAGKEVVVGLRTKERMAVAQLFANANRNLAGFGTPLAFAYASMDSFLQTATGSSAVRAISNPVKTVRELFDFASTARQMIEEHKNINTIPQARMVEYAMIAGDITGARFGLRTFADTVTRTAGITTVARLNQRELQHTGVAQRYINQMTTGQRFSRFVAQTHYNAASLVIPNAVFSTMAPIAFGHGNDPQAMSTENINRRVYETAYNMPNVINGAIGASAAYNALGAVSAWVRNSEAAARFAQRPSVQFATQNPVGRVVAPLVGMGIGA
ncbi:MAG: hypothetical protein WC426_14100, partial [Sulfuriferula sp.]